MSNRVVAVGLTLVGLCASPARAALSPCSVAIAKAVEKYVKKKQQTLSTCENKRASGTLAPTVNCRPANGAVTDPATAEKLAKAAGKVQPPSTPSARARFRPWAPNATRPPRTRSSPPASPPRCKTRTSTIATSTP